jgi:YD repeat-containing protein
VDGIVTLKTLKYDDVGNIRRVEWPNGRCADVLYDPTHLQLALWTIAYRDGCDSADPLVTKREYDRGLEAVVRVEGPGGLVSAAKYNEFGRLSEIDQPDAVTIGKISPFPAMTIDYALADAGPVRKVKTRSIFGSGANPAYAESWTYLDGFGRRLASLMQSETPDRWIVEGLASRTANGRVARVFEPTMFAGADGSTFPLALPAHDVHFTYDELGRLLTSTGLDGTTTYKYRPLEFAVDIGDPEQQYGSPHFILHHDQERCSWAHREHRATFRARPARHGDDTSEL